MEQFGPKSPSLPLSLAWYVAVAAAKTVRSFIGLWVCIAAETAVGKTFLSFRFPLWLRSSDILFRAVGGLTAVSCLACISDSRKANMFNAADGPECAAAQKSASHGDNRGKAVTCRFLSKK